MTHAPLLTAVRSWAALVFAIALSASTAAAQTPTTVPAPATLEIHDALQDRPGARLVRAGRLTWASGFSIAGAGVLSIAVGVPLCRAVGPVDCDTDVLTAGSVLLGAGMMTGMVGVAVEGEGVRKLGLGRSWPGYVGLGLLTVGGVLNIPAFAVPPYEFGLFPIGLSVAVVGLGFTAAQLVINTRAMKRLPAETRRAIFHPRPRLVVRAIPYVSSDGAGGLLVARW